FTVSVSGMEVKIPLRCLFVLSGMGFLLPQPPAGEIVRVSATDSWLRLDSRFGPVVRRRHALLPLLAQRHRSAVSAVARKSGSVTRRTVLLTRASSGPRWKNRRQTTANRTENTRNSSGM